MQAYRTAFGGNLIIFGDVDFSHKSHYPKAYNHFYSSYMA